MTFLKTTDIINKSSARADDKTGILAQLGEHLPYKQKVTGSSPVGPIFVFITILYGEIAQLARACGSYPQCRGFKSPSRYAIIPDGSRGFFGSIGLEDQKKFSNLVVCKLHKTKGPETGTFCHRGNVYLSIFVFMQMLILVTSKTFTDNCHDVAITEEIITHRCILLCLFLLP